MSRQGSFTELEIWQILEEILPVLAFVHGKNIIHRDIKPANIIRPSDGSKLVLVDFGAAKLVASGSSDQTLITAFSSIGTPNYIAPEQAKSRPVFASDLYSLGVTCIRLLTNSPVEQLFDDGTHSWEWKSRCKSRVSSNLSRVLNKLLILGTKKRYSSAKDVLKDIAKLSPTKGKKLFNDVDAYDEDFPLSTRVSWWEKIRSLGIGAQGLAAVLLRSCTS